MSDVNYLNNLFVCKIFSRRFIKSRGGKVSRKPQVVFILPTSVGAAPVVTAKKIQK